MRAVPAKLMEPFEVRECLAPRQDEYAVWELEHGLTCYRGQLTDARVMLAALQAAVRRRESAAARALREAQGGS